MAVKNKSNEIKIIRLYDAPLKAVWEAWTDPDQVAQWWGPRGFTLTTHSKDLRSGGSWSYTMHGPDGTDYPNKTQYLEVEKYKRLVYDHGANDDRPPLFRVTVLFSETDGKTKMDMSMTLPTPEAAEEARKFIKKAGGNSTWDRLAEYLAESNGKQQFVINRSFDASPKALFAMWTDPKHLSQWLPPLGFTMDFIECDIKVGGHSFYCMPGQDGFKMYGIIKYLAIDPHHSVVYSQQFADENGQPSRHPGDPTWPATMLTTVSLTEEATNQTRATVTWECWGDTSAEEMDTFIKSRAGMTQGWTGSFDKLEEYLDQGFE